MKTGRAQGIEGLQIADCGLKVRASLRGGILRGSETLTISVLMPPGPASQLVPYTCHPEWEEIFNFHNAVMTGINFKRTVLCRTFIAFFISYEIASSSTCPVQNLFLYIKKWSGQLSSSQPTTIIAKPSTSRNTDS